MNSLSKKLLLCFFCINFFTIATSKHITHIQNYYNDNNISNKREPKRFTSPSGHVNLNNPNLSNLRKPGDYFVIGNAGDYEDIFSASPMGMIDWLHESIIIVCLGERSVMVAPYFLVDSITPVELNSGLVLNVNYSIASWEVGDSEKVMEYDVFRVPYAPGTFSVQLKKINTSTNANLPTVLLANNY